MHGIQQKDFVNRCAIQEREQSREREGKGVEYVNTQTKLNN